MGMRNALGMMKNSGIDSDNGCTALQIVYFKTVTMVI